MRALWSRFGPLNSVVVSLKTGTSLRGVLVDKRNDGLVLRAASVASLDQQGALHWVKLDGDVVIPVENLDYYQEALDPEMVLA